MRLAPIPMFFKNSSDPLAFVGYANLSSELTHASLSCRCSCIYFSGLLVGALNGVSKEKLLEPYYFPSDAKKPILEPDAILDIVMGNYKNKTKDQIKSSGYVLHTLEAALWCFHNSTTFEDGLIEAVNLGEDADTTGAVYGQIAGAYYGVESIPKRWVDKTVKVDLIIDMANKLYNKRTV